MAFKSIPNTHSIDYKGQAFCPLSQNQAYGYLGINLTYSSNGAPNKKPLAQELVSSSRPPSSLQQNIHIVIIPWVE